ncbi:MAG: HAMP domain-containing sensor histidine kinase, partial [Gammaproteobacteria bacterium]
MKFYRPKSILRLILIGFSLVAMPLIVALIIATLSVDRLAGDSQHALFQSVGITQGSQVLGETLTAMERNARQYQVLGDKVLFDVYEENHAKLVETALALKLLELAGDQYRLLDELLSREREMHTILGGHAHDAPETMAAIERFPQLAETVEQIVANNRDLINRELKQIQRKAREVQRTLVYQAIALVPAALVLTALFAMLITRPINQVDQAIRRLGDGKFNEPARVQGPRDLEQLGERLNWLRTRLLELEQEKSKFLQHISHELKTPLTAIREGAELMNEQVVGNLNNQQQEITGILRDNSIQLQKLIEDLLSFSIMRSRASALVRKDVDLKALIENVLENHKVALLARKLELRTTLQPVNLSGDEEKLRILVDNLVSNAIKYSPDGGPLWVLLSKRGANALIEVADAGPGIPAAERDRIFEAFYQGEPAVKGHIRGSGLGLSIAREYAQAHGGEIWVVPSGKAGARLQVVLPIEPHRDQS